MPNEALSEIARLRGQVGAYTRLAGTPTDRLPDLTAEARAALQLKFERQADPEGVLPQEERERRAAYLRRAELARMSLKGVAARKQKAAERRRAAEQAQANVELDQLLANEVVA